MPLTKQQLTDALIFGECQRQRSLPNLLTAGGPRDLETYKAKGSIQTEATAPVVQVDALTKTHGTDVSVTVVHELSKQPRMGTEDRDGHEEDITSADFNMKVDQYHHATRVKLMIHQQEKGYDQKSLGTKLLAPYHGKLCDELMLLHAGGARGTYVADDRILPLVGADLNKIAVNPVTAPTFGRKLYCGAADSIDGSSGTTALTSADKFSPADTRKFKEHFEMMAHPPKPVRLGAGEKTDGVDPVYFGVVTPKMWTAFENNPAFQTLIANALNRTKGFKHPLFEGDMFMKDNIIFKKYYQPIGWKAGEAIAVCADDNAATESDQTAPVDIERGIIFGGQAIALAHGSVLPGGMGMFQLDGEYAQKKSRWDQWIDWVMGLAKIRFADSNGKLEDKGIVVFDSAV